MLKYTFLHPNIIRKKLIQSSLGLAIVLNAGAAYGFSISGNQIVPSTNLKSVGKWTINQISDGITSDAFPFNGFASTASKGTITLDLLGDFNLTSFKLWNDINVLREGIKDFRLDFFDSSDQKISVNFSSTFQGPIGQTAPQEYLFNQVVPSVSRVDLVVLNSHNGLFNRVEIREVEFTAVPEPTSILGTAIAGLGMLFARQRSKHQTK